MSTSTKAKARSRTSGRRGSGMRYTAEFRREALRLLDSGRPQGEVAQELNVTPGTLQRWRMKADTQEAKGAPPGPAGESVTLQNDRLKRENRTLRMELELAKKAAAFFARQAT